MSSNKIAIVFPGQGSQAVGMLGDLSAHYNQIKETFDEASQALGRDLWALAQNGPVEELNQTKDSLASMIARQKLAEQKAASITESITENEGYAKKTIARSDDSLTMELATKIAQLENDLDLENETANNARKSADQLRAVIAKSERDVQYMQTQLDTVKATENVQKAEAAVSERHSGTNSKLRTAMESLQRIKEKQALTGARIDAANELAFESREASLEQRLIDAGIKDTHNADDVLKRLKQT